MDVLFTLNYIGIRTGLKGYKRKLSTISLRLTLLDFLRYLSLGIIFCRLLVISSTETSLKSKESN